jgi:hypothetical protein
VGSPGRGPLGGSLEAGPLKGIPCTGSPCRGPLVGVPRGVHLRGFLKVIPWRGSVRSVQWRVSPVWSTLLRIIWGFPEGCLAERVPLRVPRIGGPMYFSLAGCPH